MSGVSHPVVVGASVAEFQLESPPTDGVTQVVFGHRSDVLLASSWDKTVRFYDTQHNLMKLQIDHKASVLDVCFDEDDRQCFSVGTEPSVHCTDLTTGTKSVLGVHPVGVTAATPASQQTVRCVVWHSGTQTLFTGGWDGRLCAWDTRQAKQTASATPQEGQKVREAIEKHTRASMLPE